MRIDVSNPDSYETAVELLVPELQRRGLMWDNYAVSGGTFRENLYGIPGQTHLPDHHPGTKFKWNAKEAADNDEAREDEQMANISIKPTDAVEAHDVNCFTAVNGVAVL